MTATIKELQAQLPIALEAGLVPIVLSSPGMGKSSLAKLLAKKFNLELIDIRLSYCDQTDLNGLPFPSKDHKRAQYLPVDMFPLENDPLPEGKNGWLILFDELPSATPAVQVAAYKVLLDRYVGNHALHKNVFMMAAGNKATDNAVVHKIGTAMQSRLIHYEMKENHEQWLEWAEENGIDYRVISYIRYMPNRLMDFNPDHNDHTFPCPRTWEFVSKALKVTDRLGTKAPEDIDLTIYGSIGENIGREFVSFLQIFKNLVTVEQILKDPHNTKVPTSPNELFALSGTIIENYDPDKLGILMTYLKRLPIEFQIITVKAIIKKNPAATQSYSVKDWLTTTGRQLT
tara:strand:- start:7068 stop:8099 length:1032 start_codon:yes stop_codon:yes gene_type:complete